MLGGFASIDSVTESGKSWDLTHEMDLSAYKVPFIYGLVQLTSTWFLTGFFHCYEKKINTGGTSAMNRINA